VLEGLKAKGVLAGYESATALLPSPATQRARLDALPARDALEASLRAAQRGLPFRPDTFAPFLSDVEAARTGSLLTRGAYAGTPAAARLDALLVQQDGAWLALTPVAGLRDAAALEAALAGSASRLVDLKRVTAGMLDGYLRESSRQVAYGAALIALLLVVGLRSVRRALRVLLPSAAALCLTVGLLAACGVRLGVFHLVALLLVLGIGLNYALFLEAAVSNSARRARAAQALALCVATTVLTFGLLAASATPVLRAIGLTVAIGALLSVVLALAWTPAERSFR
jgi:predicted exporter